MAHKLFSCLKIYLFLFLYIAIAFTSYAFYLLNTNSDINLVCKIVLVGLSFLVLGFSFGNSFQKKGLLVGIIVALIHIIIIKLISYLANDIFSINLIELFIYILLCAIGGIIGVNIKKIF